MSLVVSAGGHRHLVEALETLGWQFGAPPHITSATLAVDILSGTRMTCPGCGRRGMTCKPYRLGRRYAVVASCRCGAAELM